MIAPIRSVYIYSVNCLKFVKLHEYNEYKVNQHT